MMVFKAILLVILFSFAGIVPAAQIDINTASAELIAKNLKGIGPSKAAAIVEFREANGPFKKVTDLSQVKGIGQKTLDANKENIRFVSDN